MSSIGAPVIYEYPSAVRGWLVRRYKRFLADIVLQPSVAGRHSQGAGGSRGAPGAPPVTAAAASGPGQAPAVTVVAAGAAAAATAAAAVVSPGMAAVAATATGVAAASPEVAAAAAVAAAGGATTCHCPNTGPMTGLLDWPLAPVVCSVSSAAGRKYPHTLEMVQPCPGGPWVGVHSALANGLVVSLLQRRLLPQLGEWDELQREVPYGSQRSRVDFVLTRPTGRKLFVEVKSVTLAEPYRPLARAPPQPRAQEPAQPATTHGAPAAEGPAAPVPATAVESADGGGSGGGGSGGNPQRLIALFPDTHAQTFLMQNRSATAPSATSRT
ncbi:hypothetical protein GPECTOR_102g60 [Gonium pectorale]|uniref:Sugar fermentation stimulation protein C-terminal domain-containing protein n=1 Tax=Gonium pectorale TaxID=33097 RepID=A0A150FZU1_GONPE|nr:hypothetical protein GPECTOR_102g60 [Gonium pectorale]|eukprot:KXZ43107.1 hypothetical protein GPECTOR_102g60 [Gonium pectorale]